MTEATSALVLCDDLLFVSRITTTARAAGANVLVVRTVAELESLAEHHSPRCVILDLSNATLHLEACLAMLRRMCNPLPRVIAFGSHVDAATLRAAREAGCDLVLPRSKFVEDLPKELPHWLSARADGTEAE